MKRSLCVLIVVCLAQVACKKKPVPEPAPAPAPAQPVSAQGTDDDDDENAYLPPAGGPVELPDQGRPDRSPPPPPPPPPPKAISTDADLAAYKEAKDRADTEVAVQRSVTTAIPRMVQCFDRSKVEPGKRTLRVRVHRSGRVLSASVDGVDDTVNRCVEQALGSLRVSGVKTDTIDVQRTVNYTR